jgi:hypothetical protein
MVVSMPSTKELTVWIGDVLELVFNSHREEKRPTRLRCKSAKVLW